MQTLATVEDGDTQHKVGTETLNIMSQQLFVCVADIKGGHCGSEEGLTQGLLGQDRFATVPAPNVLRPARQSSRVLLPAPLTPSTAVISAGFRNPDT